MAIRCVGCDGEFLGEAGDISFCAVCFGMTDQRTNRFYPAILTGTPPPIEPVAGDDGPFRQWDIEALAKRYLTANRRLHTEYGIAFDAPGGLPPLYDDLSTNHQLLLKAALAEAVVLLEDAPST